MFTQVLYLVSRISLYKAEALIARLTTSTSENHFGAKLSYKTRRAHQFPIEVAEVRWRNSRNAHTDVGIAFAGQDVPSEALDYFE